MNHNEKYFSLGILFGSVYNYMLIKSKHYGRILLNRAWELSSFRGLSGPLEVIYSIFFSFSFNRQSVDIIQTKM